MANGYCNLLSISDKYSCLIYAIRDDLWVFDDKAIYNLVKNKSRSQAKQIKLPANI